MKIDKLKTDKSKFLSLSNELGITDSLRERIYIKDEEGVQEIIKRCGFRRTKETLAYLRGTGRTTRLIQDAIANFIQGKNVIIYTHSFEFKRHLFGMINDELERYISKDGYNWRIQDRILKRPYSLIGVKNNTIELRVLDKDTWRRLLHGFDGHGWHTNNQRGDIILIDHQAIENKIGHIIEHWFSYLLKENDD
jgi:hypothetical protein